MSEDKVARPIGKLTQELLGEPFPDEEKRPLRKHKSASHADSAEEKEERGIPWFLIGSIVVLIIFVGIAGFIAYKYWKKR
jgi:cytoskeletal protein RodZ